MAYRGFELTPFVGRGFEPLFSLRREINRLFKDVAGGRGESMSQRKVPGWVQGLVAVGGFAALLWAEHRRSLRRPVESKRARAARNLAVATVSAVAVQLAERPLIAPVTAVVERRRIGLLQRLALPRWLDVLLAGVLMDYTLYWWHVLEHRVPFLWRFHQVHHADLDLDASTALRFHFGELMLSVPWRAGQVLALGVSPRAYGVWQKALLASITFHHSNLRLPLRLERWLCRLIVTPRLHGIHHSIVPEETKSNWSSGLTLWDFLHGTERLNVAQDEIIIGVPEYREPSEVTLPKILAMPFRAEGPTGLLPGDGAPVRAPTGAPRDHLLP